MDINFEDENNVDVLTKRPGKDSRTIEIKVAKNYRRCRRLHPHFH